MELEQAVEHLEHAGHAGPSRLRTVVSLLIVALTAAGALVGYAAVRANTHAEESGRLRQLQVVKSELDKNRVSSLMQAADRVAVSTSDLTIRYNELQIQSNAAPNDAFLAEAAQRESAAVDAANKVDPASDKAIASLTRSANEAEQRAILLGDQTERWVHKEDVYVGIIGTLAVSLFLLGIALTVPASRIRRGFVVLSAGLAVIGVARAVATERSPLPELKPAALSALLDARQSLDKQQDDQALASLKKAVAADPEYSQAWIELSRQLTLRAVTSEKDVEAGIEATRKAIETGSKSPVTLSNLAYFEMLKGDTAAAVRDGAAAAALSPEDPEILFVEAETALGHHELAKALKLAGKAEELVTSVDGSFRDTLLSNQAADEARMAGLKVGVEADLATYFASIVEAQASIEAFKSPEPRDLHGATLTGISFLFDKDTGRYSFRADEHSHEAGDVISVRVSDADTNTFEPNFSRVALTPTGPQEVTVTADSRLTKGKYRVDVFLNGHLQKSTDLEATA